MEDAHPIEVDEKTLPSPALEIGALNGIVKLLIFCLPHRALLGSSEFCHVRGPKFPFGIRPSK